MSLPNQTATVRIALHVLGERITVEATRPADPARLDELLPFLRAIDDAVVDQAVRHAEKDGHKVSCQKGCSACCRAQPVPVTPPETYALLRLVESFPEPRSTTVRQRFAERVQRLRAAGLADHYLQRDPTLGLAAAREIAERYFALGLVCPFLEEDACSIYADRPFVCRQYLVTSPAELCSDLFHNPVRQVKMPIAAAGASLRTTEAVLGTPQYTVPLVLALEYAEAHRAELEQTHAAAPVAERWVKAMFDKADEGETGA